MASQKAVDAECVVCKQSSLGYRESAAIVEPEKIEAPSALAWKDVLKAWWSIILIAIMIVIAGFIPVIMAKFMIGLCVVALIVGAIYGIVRLIMFIHKHCNLRDIIDFSMLFSVCAGTISLVAYIAYQIGNKIVSHFQ